MNAFLKYAARRFVQFVFVIFTGITLAFLIAHLSPVDPVEQSLSLMTGFSASDPRAIEILRQSLSDLYGVKGSLIDQYLIFWRRVLTGDFGPSLSAFPTPVMTIILRAMPWTFGLLVLSTIFAWIVGNTLGALAGYFRDNRFLKVIGMGVMAMQPMPTYIIGLTLVICLGYLWPIFPISGGAQVNLRAGASTGPTSRSVLVHGTLPALTLVLVGLGGWFISMRSLVSNIVTDDHVVYAELAGVRSRSHLQPIRRPQCHAAAGHRPGAQPRPRLQRRRHRRIHLRLSRHGPIADRRESMPATTAWCSASPPSRSSRLRR